MTQAWAEDEVADLISLIAGKWALAILEALTEGPLRRRALRDRLEGVSDKVLTETLRRLETSGLIIRTVVPSVPVEVDYSISPLGDSLSLPLSVIAEWVRTTGFTRS